MTAGTSAIDVTCATCKSPRDKRCVDGEGNELVIYHIARINGARAQTRAANLSKKTVRTK